MNLLADRYGWTYSSQQLRTYIRRSGAYQKQAAKKVFSNQVLKVQEENQALKETVQQLEHRMKQQEQQMKALLVKILKETEKKHTGY